LFFEELGEMHLEKISENKKALLHVLHG